VTPGPFDQQGFRVAFDWGPAGVARLARGAAAVVVVDVLRFTTCVDVVVAAGGRVRDRKSTRLNSSHNR
jgi:2-phosphosulfolactate phosphatase